MTDGPADYASATAIEHHNRLRRAGGDPTGGWQARLSGVALTVTD